MKKLYLLPAPSPVLVTRLFLFAFLCYAVLPGCIPGKSKQLNKEWYLSGNDYKDYVNAESNLIFRFYPGGVYTQFGNLGYALGKWRMNEHGGYIFLEQEKGTLHKPQQYLKIEKWRSDGLTAGLFYKMPFDAEKRKTLLVLKGLENESRYDPYRPELQEWRLQPAHPETDAFIQKRVISYLHFMQALYQHAIDNELSELKSNWYPSPLQLQFYNAVRMAYSTELDDWNHCFYDSAQAVKGYQVISGVISDITLKKGVNTFERNLDCVNQLLKQIEK